MEKPFPAYKGDDPYVFVCYAHADQAVYAEIRWLQDQGINVWYDEGISAGRVWRAEIVKALEGASNFLYYISEASLDSTHCNREVDYALDKELEVVPVYLDETELTPELRLALNRVQALHRVNDENYQQHLLGALAQTSTTQHTAVTNRKKPARPLYVGLGLAIAVLASGSWWYQQRATSPDEILSPGSVEEERTPIIAVLPLDNISGDESQDYFGDGVTREIYQQMTRLSGLRVIAMRSSLHFRDSTVDIRQIGQQLGADYLIEGSVNRSGNLVRISVNLIDAQDGTHLLGQSYDRSVADVGALFSIYDAVAGDISTSLEGLIGEQAADSQPIAIPTDSLAAYDLLRQGVWLARTAGNPGEGLKLIDQALAIDPTYIEARAERAYELVNRAESGFVPAKENFEIAKREVLEILKLNPNHAMAVLVQGRLQVQLELDFPKAMASYNRAEQLGVHSPLVAIFKAALMLNSGHYSDALALMREAEILDPVNASVKEFLARCLQRTGNIEASYRKFDEALALEPRNEFILFQALLHSFYIEDTTRARELIENAPTADLVPSFAWPLIQLIEGDPNPYKTSLAQRQEQRNQHFVRAQAFMFGYWFLGDYENHIRWVMTMEEENDTLYFLNYTFSWFEDYWNILQDWPASEPDKQNTRLKLLREHRERIDRITEKMVL